MRQLNSEDIKIRDEILGLSRSKYLYVVGGFDKLSLDKFKTISSTE